MNTIINEMDGTVILNKHYIQSADADLLFAQLHQQLAWNEEVFNIYGKTVLAPRLVGWYGDSDSNYTYSGITHNPQPWHPLLLELKNKIENDTGHFFNSVLANLYRNERDSMGWHADKEKELGINPAIASLSLGETRLFKIRHNKSKKMIDIELANGSLIVMHGKFQHCWQHSVPKSGTTKKPRINLTFRLIHKKT